MRGFYTMDLRRYPGIMMLLLETPWKLRLSKLLGGHSMFSITGRILSWHTLVVWYTPYRESGKAKISIAPASGHSPILNNFRELLAAVNTALDDTNNMLAKAQRKNYTQEAHKRLFEATLNGDDRPVIRDGVVEPHVSPTPKRPRYNFLDAHTGALP
jgi:hypothetical protein